MIPSHITIRRSLVLISRAFLANTHRRSFYLRAGIHSPVIPTYSKIFNKEHFPGINNFIRQTKMCSSSTSNLVAEHDPDSKKFFIKLGDDEAKLEYVKNGDVLNMWHTEVPPALQGKGIAKILAQEAFDYAVKQNLKMKLTCTYLQKYYKDNPKPEYKSHVV